MDLGHVSRVSQELTNSVHDVHHAGRCRNYRSYGTAVLTRRSYVRIASVLKPWYDLGLKYETIGR